MANLCAGIDFDVSLHSPDLLTDLEDSDNEPLKNAILSWKQPVNVWNKTKTNSYKAQILKKEN